MRNDDRSERYYRNVDLGESLFDFTFDVSGVVGTCRFAYEYVFERLVVRIGESLNQIVERAFFPDELLEHYYLTRGVDVKDGFQFYQVAYRRKVSGNSSAAGEIGEGVDGEIVKNMQSDAFGIFGGGFCIEVAGVRLVGNHCQK